MKKIVIAISCCLFFGNGYSQKLDLDREIWTHSYVKLPKSTDLTSSKTYAVNMTANMDNLNRLGLSSNKVESLLKLDGFVYTTGLADIVFEVTIENFRKIAEDIETRETSAYEGGKNVTKKTYVPITSFSVPTTVKVVKSSSKEELVNKTVGFSENLVAVASGEYPTYEAARASFTGTDEKRVESFKEKYYNLLTNEFNGFREKYDFKIEKESDYFWHIDLKKSPEFGEFNEKLTAAKEIFAKQNASDDIKAAREQLSSTLQYWRENADKTLTEDKKGKKLKYAYLINLAKTQLWLEMFDECAVTAQQIIDNDYDKSDGKNLLRQVTQLREEFKNSPNGSRHFSRDGFTSTAQFKITEVQPLPFKFPSPPYGFKAYDGTMVTTTGEKISGKLWASAYILGFEPQSGTKFVYEKNGSLTEQSIDLSAIEEISLVGGEKFVRLKNNDYMMFFQVLHESANYRILKYFRSNEGKDATIAIADLNNGKEMCLFKKSTGAIQSVGAHIASNAAKKTAEFYASCEALKTKILAGEFGKMNDLDGQVKALNFCEQNCK